MSYIIYASTVTIGALSGRRAQRTKQWISDQACNVGHYSLLPWCIAVPYVPVACTNQAYMGMALRPQLLGSGMHEHDNHKSHSQRPS